MEKRKHYKKSGDYISEEKGFAKVEGQQRSFGQRWWTVETVFSCLKRMFGEYVYSVRLKNMIQEMMLKASLYNKSISL